MCMLSLNDNVTVCDSTSGFCKSKSSATVLKCLMGLSTGLKMTACQPQSPRCRVRVYAINTAASVINVIDTGFSFFTILLKGMTEVKSVVRHQTHRCCQRHATRTCQAVEPIATGRIPVTKANDGRFRLNVRLV